VLSWDRWHRDRGRYRQDVPSVSFSRASSAWLVQGDIRRGGPYGELVLKREELTQLPAVELRRAMASNAEYFDVDETQATVSAVPAAYFDEDAPIEPIEFKWDAHGLVIKVALIAPWPEHGDEERGVAELRTLIQPFLDATRSSLRKAEVDAWLSSPPDIGYEIEIDASLRGRSVGDLFTIGEGVLRLCEAFANAAVARETIGDLVRGGGARLLVGQPEGNWLDAKAQEYDLRTLHGEISLAQAVARFCNAEDGGLIVIGAEAKKVPGGEIIRRVEGVGVLPGIAARYQRVLDRRLYPPPLGMRIDVVSVTEQRSLIVIDIPPQTEELKPFLVHGAIRVDGQTEGAFISIVQRRGEASIAITAPMIHATLAAGRALLRGGKSHGDGSSSDTPTG